MTMDATEIKRQVPVEDILRNYGSQADTHGRYSCLFPERHNNGDRKHSVSIHSGCARCWSQRCFGEKGADVFALVGLMEDLDEFPDQKRRVMEISGLADKATPQASSRIVDTYDYTDEAGALLFQAVRLEPKDFKQRQPDGKGDWIWNLKGIRRILYRLPDVVNADSVLIVEGEKDVETAYRIGMPEGWAASCNPMGAEKWRPEYSDTLKGKRVVILPDADEAGYKHRDKVARALVGVASEVLTIPSLDGCKDLSDWAAAGGTPDQFKAILENATPWIDQAATAGQREAGTHEAEHEGSNDSSSESVQDAFPITESPSDFPEPISLYSAPLPELSSGLFSPWMDEMVCAVAAHTETPLELATMLGLSVLATACQDKFSVCPEPGYVEPLNIWTLAAMESGNRKSAVLQRMTRPLLDWDFERAQTAKNHIKEVESNRETLEARVRNLRMNAAKDNSEDFEDAKKEIAKLEASLPEVPRVPRVWTQDITPEKLGQVMADNDGSLAILSDEGGIFDIMAGRYNAGQINIDIFLQAHSGIQVRVDRGSRDAVFMRNPALTMGLSPQPAVLQSLACKPGFRGRGLLARFLYVLPSSSLGFRSLDSRPIPSGVDTRYQQGITTLLNIQPNRDENNQPVRCQLQLSQEARSEWKDFARSVEEDMRDGNRFEYIKDWAGKLPGAAARLAGILHCCEHASSQPGATPISLKTMKSALHLASVLSFHALAVFDQMGSDPVLDDARKVLKWVERNRKPTFSARDCFQALKGSFPRVQDIEPAMSVLKERGYLYETTLHGKLGRPSCTFMVNPALTKEWL